MITKRRTLMISALVLTVGVIAAYAIFNDSESITRTASAGSLDISVEPEAQLITNFAAGDRMERPVRISIPTAGNDGFNIAAFRVNMTNSSSTICTDINEPFNDSYYYECDNPDASLIDDEALQFRFLSCPGILTDSDPTVDSDGDPSTPSVSDGIGPFTCQGANFRSIMPRTAITAVDGSTTYTFTPRHVAGQANVAYPQRTFVPGKTYEMLACFTMPDDPYNDGLPDDDFENLTATIDIEVEAVQRDGVLLGKPPVIVNQTAGDLIGTVAPQGCGTP